MAPTYSHPGLVRHACGTAAERTLGVLIPTEHGRWVEHKGVMADSGNRLSVVDGLLALTVTAGAQQHGQHEHGRCLANAAGEAR